MLDTGATLSAISYKSIIDIGLDDMIRPCSHYITVADNRKVHVNKEL